MCSELEEFLPHPFELEELGRVAMLFKPLHELSHLVEIGVELRAVLGAVDGLNLAVD